MCSDYFCSSDNTIFSGFSNTIPWFRNSDDNPFKPSDEEPSFLLGKGWKGGKE